MPSITIDGKHLDVRAGTTILDTTKRAKIQIPTLAHHVHLKRIHLLRANDLPQGPHPAGGAADLRDPILFQYSIINIHQHTGYPYFYLLSAYP